MATTVVTTVLAVAGLAAFIAFSVWLVRKATRLAVTCVEPLVKRMIGNEIYFFHGDYDTEPATIVGLIGGCVIALAILTYSMDNVVTSADVLSTAITSFITIGVVSLVMGLYVGSRILWVNYRNLCWERKARAEG